MALSSSERPEGPSRVPVSRHRRRAAAPGPDDPTARTDALRIAVETLSYEIRWYFAHDEGARAAALTDSRRARDSASRRPTS